MRFSAPPNMGSPAPTGRPVTAHSTTPPTLSQSRRAASTTWRMRSLAAASMTGEVLPCKALQQLGRDGDRVKGLVLGLADGGHVGGHQNPPALEQLPGDGPGEHQRRCEPAGEVPAAPDVVVIAVLHIGGVVGVAGPGQHPQAAVILGALVGVLDDGAQGRARW